MLKPQRGRYSSAPTVFIFGACALKINEDDSVGIKAGKYTANAVLSVLNVGGNLLAAGGYGILGSGELFADGVERLDEVRSSVTRNLGLEFEGSERSAAFTAAPLPRLKRDLSAGGVIAQQRNLLQVALFTNPSEGVGSAQVVVAEVPRMPHLQKTVGFQGAAILDSGPVTDRYYLMQDGTFRAPDLPLLDVSVEADFRRLGGVDQLGGVLSKAAWDPAVCNMTAGNKWLMRVGAQTMRQGDERILNALHKGEISRHQVIGVMYRAYHPQSDCYPGSVKSNQAVAELKGETTRL